MEQWNRTIVTEFILQGFHLIPELEICLFVIFLLIYLLTLMGNLLIIVLVCSDHHLHMPMYYFLCNFSFLEIVITTTVVPKMLTNLLAKKKTISFLGCMTQSFFYFLMGTIEFFVISAMAFDRYVAICNPLHYSTILRWRVCHYLILCSWLGGFLSISTPTVLKLQLPFCGPNVINHFFCDSGPLIKLACTDTRFIQLLDFFLFSFVVLSSLILTMVSYIYITVTILRIPSSSGRKKAFSTCAAHLIIVALGFGSTIFIYVTPFQGSSLGINKLICVLTVFVTPALSPFIFTLKNEKVKEVLKNAIAKRLMYIC
ncbi:olfactory receptor 6J1-like [Microcaecilia unicolor]|uniref:Olfactory receptor n=1 Tax=Microcaecilia unicolor TaxID=1415580 RepID=A0A6P7WWY8_9AMPH|nr:olfactory receptor 6J1-like [Microcaecilia unicolor]